MLWAIIFPTEQKISKRHVSAVHIGKKNGADPSNNLTLESFSFVISAKKDE